MAISNKQYREASADLRAGLENWRVWLFLGVTDIRLRYRRTIIGPFWMTLSSAIMITAMGFVWGIIFQAELKEFFPYLAAGLVTWFLISTMITESTSVISGSPASLRDFNLPISFLALRLVVRNCIVFMHNVVVYFAVALIFDTNFLTAKLPLAIVGVLLLLVNGTWIALVLGIVGARFRDIQQLVTAIMTILFLITPIMWQRQLLQDNQFIATFNPITHFIEVVRQPLLGSAPSFTSLCITLAISAIGWLGAYFLLARTRQRVVFWL